MRWYFNRNYLKFCFLYMIVQGKPNMSGFYRKTPKGTHLHLSTGLPGIARGWMPGFCSVSASPLPAASPCCSTHRPTLTLLFLTAVHLKTMCPKGAAGSYLLTICFSPSVALIRSNGISSCSSFWKSSGSPSRFSPLSPAHLLPARGSGEDLPGTPGLLSFEAC